MFSSWALKFMPTNICCASHALSLSILWVLCRDEHLLAWWRCLSKDISSPQSLVWVTAWDCCHGDQALPISSRMASFFSVKHSRFTINRPREPWKESKIILWSWVARAHERPKPVYPWQHQDGILSWPLTPLSQCWMLREEVEIRRDSIQFALNGCLLLM